MIIQEIAFTGFIFFYVEVVLIIASAIKMIVKDILFSMFLFTINIYFKEVIDLVSFLLTSSQICLTNFATDPSFLTRLETYSFKQDF